MTDRLDSPQSMRTELDFCFTVHGEKKEDLGEDSYAIDVNDRAAFLGVFDGCGGSGARYYPEFGNRTGAYIASRVAAEASLLWFADWSRTEEEGSPAESLKNAVDRRLAEFRDVSQTTSMLKSSMTRAFPTTLAAEILRDCPEDPESIRLDCLWSGDSRCYVLETSGLHQISVDDLPVTDAMQNLREDAAMLNVVSASHRYEIHAQRMEIRRPCICITATDGCFGYFKSPMEFEKIIIGTLINARSIADWKNLMRQIWQNTAGDDYTVCMAGAGFGSFENVQNSFRLRQSRLETLYPTKAEMKEEVLFAQWEDYRAGYEKYQRLER